MPLYTYLCHDCKRPFEQRRAMSQAHDPLNCPVCGSPNTSKTINLITVIGRGQRPLLGANVGGCSSCSTRKPSACAACR